MRVQTALRSRLKSSDGSFVHMAMNLLMLYSSHWTCDLNNVVNKMATNSLKTEAETTPDMLHISNIFHTAGNIILDLKKVKLSLCLIS
jgi:hypothetical protein